MKKAGAIYSGSPGHKKCLFRVWAPEKQRILLHLVHPEARKLEMQKTPDGYFEVMADDLLPGARYFFKPEAEADLPDPASDSQPEGVHGPSEVVDHKGYDWQDRNWRGARFKDLIFYEMHVGTFTPEGTFEAIIPRLKELAETGINALELMPVSQFPGSRNWGYDGVFPFAVQQSYGGPEGLKKLVDACHAHGISVFLDVVYNHQGPEGNYFEKFGPYFTDRYKTPWGKALNFDGEWSDGVREFYVQNALHWFENYHLDGLRVDAIHAVYDAGAVPFWELLTERVKELSEQLGRSLHLVSESDFNSPKVVKSPEAGGLGFEAQWLDDFHHALYVLLDKNGRDRYIDFGKMEQLAKAYTDGFVHSGEYVKFRKRKHGASSAGISGEKFVAFNQNHDQVGNRVKGERLSMLVNFDRLKLAAAALLLSPYVPLLFMGEEYGEEAPFFYFVSHSDPKLVEAVRKGRQEEFAVYGFDQQPPDAQDEQTFLDSKLQWEKRRQGKHLAMLRWYRDLIRLRRTLPVLQNFSKNDVRANLLQQEGLVLHRQTAGGAEHLLCIFNFSGKPLSCSLPDWSDNWHLLLNPAEEKYREPGSTAQKEPPIAIVSAGTEITVGPLAVLLYSSTENSRDLG